MTVAEFLPWAEEAHARGEGRFELVDGVVTAMNAERAVHWKTKLAVAVALLAGVRRAKLPCHVVPDGASVNVDDATTYEPDAIVYCGDEVEPTSLTVPNPLILVEVISPSTGHIDKGDKLENYFRIPSVQHYLMVYPDQRMACTTSARRRARSRPASLTTASCASIRPGSPSWSPSCSQCRRSCGRAWTRSYRSISPNTMSIEPSIADTSASMWPRFM
jgi:Uma2 family endonuclease